MWKCLKEIKEGLKAHMVANGFPIARDEIITTAQPHRNNRLYIAAESNNVAHGGMGRSRHFSISCSYKSNINTERQEQCAEEIQFWFTRTFNRNNGFMTVPTTGGTAVIVTVLNFNNAQNVTDTMVTTSTLLSVII